MTMTLSLLILSVASFGAVALSRTTRRERPTIWSDVPPTRAVAFAAHKEIEDHRKELQATRASLGIEAVSAIELGREDLARDCLTMQIEIDEQISVLDRRSKEIDERLDILKDLVRRGCADEMPSHPRRPDTERPLSLTLIEGRIEKARESIDALTIASRIGSKPRGMDDLTNLSREVLVEDRLTEIRHATGTKVYTHVR